eukprot:gene3454-1875_t
MANGVLLGDRCPDPQESSSHALSIAQRAGPPICDFWTPPRRLPDWLTQVQVKSRKPSAPWDCELLRA